MVADMACMGHKSKLRAQRRSQVNGLVDGDTMSYPLTASDQEMVEEFLANMGFEGDLAGRQFLIQIQEQQGVVTFDNEGRLITAERSHA